MVDGPKRFRRAAPKAERLSTSHSADVRRDGTVLGAPVCPESLPAAGSKGVSPALFLLQASTPAPFYSETLPAAGSNGRCDAFAPFAGCGLWLSRGATISPIDFYANCRSGIIRRRERPIMEHTLLANPVRWTDPRTWPWMVYVWLAFFAFGWLKWLWRWMQRNRTESWPIATGQIESASIAESKSTFFSSPSRGNSPKIVVELGYAYSVAGNVEGGIYKREFATDEEALQFQRDLKGRPVAVHYSPSKPSNSTLSESSIETLLQTRAPKTAGELISSTPKKPLPTIVSQFLWVFIAVSFVGLVLSLWVHFGAVMGRRVAPDALFWILHLGIFVVWIPALVIAKRRVGDPNRKDFWKLVLRDLPDGVRYLIYGFLGYAFVNFFYFFIQESNEPSGSGEPSAMVWRGFSGHWMAFYIGSLAILYSATKEKFDTTRCLNGHSLPPEGSFCAQCGQAAMHR